MLLREIGCGFGQGRLFADATAPAELELILAGSRVRGGLHAHDDAPRAAGRADA